jgi:hypothetical protein
MESGNVSIISKKFWISFFDYYFKLAKKLTNYSLKKGSAFIFNYGFDTLCLIGK